ncbi:hypothetical protein Misp01_06900 [Microtetraspora sp. NBRC 13810]|uniref:beta-propeller domain-containing protein n=1 Tax=Microtetraspora sp. NBRC 13810 TaxID=3030990 RepID=UPI0024A07420|nr:beta-propeller domain-containing protein [Microtetraspora sp. NBRC 13810]GLW05560.1 hypothetical protein Misp01_06900 [Microtetraspora sp. NBRC 13810]
MSSLIRRTGAAALSAAVLATAGACSLSGSDREAGRTGPPPVNLSAARLVAYSSCDDLLAGLREKTAQSVSPWGLLQPYAFAVQDGGPAADARTLKSGAPASSTTNVHEAGVDEPDMVKTDGTRIVTVDRGVLRVIDAASRKITGTVRLVPAGQAGWAPSDLLLNGDRALVLFSGSGIVPFDASVKRVAGAETRYVLVDLSGKPSVAGSIKPNGAHVDARMIGSTIRLVVRSAPVIDFPHPDFNLPQEKQPSEQELLRRNRELVMKAPLSAWLPSYTVTDAAGEERVETVPCERVSHPEEYTGTSMVTVHTLDLAAGDRTLTTDEPISVAAEGENVYGTATSLYVASNPRPQFPPAVDVAPLPVPTDAPPATSQAPPPVKTPTAPPGDPEMPTLLPEPAPTQSSVAPAQEPTPAEPPPPGSPSPVTPTAVTPTAVTPTATGSAGPPPPPEQSEIHRFDITGSGPPRYVASGVVPGRLLNQYSLSEHEGHLRVATTTTNSRTDSESGVHVLDTATLGEVGRVTGLGKGEQIYSVRFIGPVGYVVTFRQVDPLYTLDLRDPKAPRVTGELKITGYSAYLHPAGDGRLIGVGQEATEQGRTRGMQISLFDVRDPAAPRRLAQLFQKDSGTEAEWDPHAFLSWEDLVVVPLSSWSADGAEASNSALVLRVGADAVDRVGEVRHPEIKLPGTDQRMEPVIRRFLVIGDTLWTVSEAGLKASDLNTLADQAWIPFN